jgi:hypothetical protein
MKKTRINDKKEKLVMITHPPAINDFQVRHSTILRYVATAQNSATITAQNLLDTINVATTAVAPYNLFRYVKIRKIEVWSLPALGAANTVSVTFTGNGSNVVGDERTHTDTSMGLEPAHIQVRPSKKSLISNYMVSAAVTVFNITVPPGAVIDLHLSFQGSTLANSNAAQNASVGAPVGSTFWRGFDGLAFATTNFALPTGIAQF